MTFSVQSSFTIHHSIWISISKNPPNKKTKFPTESQDTKGAGCRRRCWVEMCGLGLQPKEEDATADSRRSNRSRNLRFWRSRMPLVVREPECCWTDGLLPYYCTVLLKLEALKNIGNKKWKWWYFNLACWHGKWKKLSPPSFQPDYQAEIYARVLEADFYFSHAHEFSHRIYFIIYSDLELGNTFLFTWNTLYFTFRDFGNTFAFLPLGLENTKTHLCFSL